VATPAEDRRANTNTAVAEAAGGRSFPAMSAAAEEITGKFLALIGAIAKPKKKALLDV